MIGAPPAAGKTALVMQLVFEAVRLGSQGDLVGHTLLALAKTVGTGSRPARSMAPRRAWRPAGCI
jgi:hypothetical protein